MRNTINKNAVAKTKENTSRGRKSVHASTVRRWLRFDFPSFSLEAAQRPTRQTGKTGFGCQFFGSLLPGRGVIMWFVSAWLTGDWSFVYAFVGNLRFNDRPP